MTQERRRKRAASRSSMTLRLRWTKRAVEDLEQIAEYIARDKPRAAERWVEQLIAVAERAAALPSSGRRVPEIARDDVRELRRRSYRVVYLVTATHVDILTVFEGHRLLPSNVIPDREDGER